MGGFSFEVLLRNVRRSFMTRMGVSENRDPNIVPYYKDPNIRPLIFRNSHMARDPKPEAVSLRLSWLL